MDFENKVPEWKNAGAEPDEELKTKGFTAGYKPPANLFNWFYSLISKAITELQTKLSGHATANNPHGITAKTVGLDKVNNTPDSEKAVNFASEAGIGRKLKYALTLRFNGGNTEGTDKWTFDGSTSRSVNITPEKIGAAKEIDGLKVVAATSTDGELYTATLDSVTELYNGLEITIIPNMTSTKSAIQFALNDFGTKNLRVKIDGYNSGNSGTISALPTWIGENYPLTIRYVSKFDMWQTVDFSRQSVSGLYGTVKLEQGGTGATTAEGARTNLGAAHTFYKEVEVPNTGWAEANGAYVQTVWCDEVRATDTPIVDVLTVINDPDANINLVEAWSHIETVICGDEGGYLFLFTDGEIPATSFTMKIKVVR